MKARKQEIEHKFQQEKSLWNSEKVRLTQLLRKAENENACNDLKKRFVDVICTLLLKTGEKREWENDQLCQIADEMLTAAKGITNVEDNVIPQLQKKLEELLGKKK